MEHDVQLRRERFAAFVEERVVPLMQRAVDRAVQRGARAEYRQETDEAGPAIELMITPPGLPPRARPPCFTLRPASEGSRPLTVDITGTFPNAGPAGVFGGQIEYDTVYPDQVEDQILNFLAMALGD